MNRWLVVTILMVGCGDNLAPDTDAGPPDAPPGFVTAPHTLLPVLLPHHGVVLDHVQLVTVTYDGYADRAGVEAFGDAIVTSPWYATVGAEYGVGAGTHLAKVHATAPARLQDYAAVENEMQRLLTEHVVPTPPATGSQLFYILYLPPTLPLGPDLANCCYGYHQMITDAATGRRVPFAVILDDGSGLDTTTTTASHELIEGTTDPYDPPADGWYVDPPATDPWWLLLEENADLCNFEPMERDGGFAVQRSWSMAAAAAGRAPCVPNHGDDEWYDVSAQPAAMPTVAKGGSVTFTLTGWSTKEVPDWTLDLYDADYSELPMAQLQPMLSATHINNGQTVTLTLHVPASAGSGKASGVYVLSGEHQRPWAVGFIVQ